MKTQPNCIRCGTPYERRLHAPVVNGKAKAFEDRYCLDCADTLPLGDVVVCIPADHVPLSNGRSVWKNPNR